MQHQVAGNRKAPVPERLFARLHYASISRTVTDTSLGAARYAYNLNNPYDPDPAVGGSSAAYWTELGINYDKYICWGSRIRVTATTTDATDQAQPVALWVVPTAANGGTTNYVPKDIASMKVIPNCRYGYADSFDRPKIVVTNEMKIKQYEGFDPRGSPMDWGGLASGNYKVLDGRMVPNGTNPAINLFWMIGCQRSDGSADTQLNIQVEIEYFTEFNTPVAPLYYNAAFFKAVDIVDGKVVERSDKAPLPAPDPSQVAPPYEDMTDSVLVERVVKAVKASSTKSASARSAT